MITLLHNGTIYTMNPQQPRAQALAIQNGRVLAVGSHGRVLAATAGRRVEALDLHGRAVVPGLTDSHVHITWYGLALQQVNLAGVRSLDEALACVAATAQALSPGAWLQGGGWNHTEWDGTWPTRTQLDSVCPDRPAILVRKDGHSAWVNSHALALAQIDARTPDPVGGQIQRANDGSPTGMLLESAIDLVRRMITPLSPEDRRAALRAALDEALSYGLTSLHIPPGPDPHDGPQTLTDLKLLYERGELSLRCLAHIAAPDLDAALALGLRSGVGDSWLRLGGLKLFADGSLGSETAEMLTHYEGRRHLGVATLTPDELNDLVLRANQGGLCVMVHAIGDAANRKVLDAIERARKAGVPPLPMPNRIEHVQVVHPTDLPRFAALDVVASMQPAHATSDMHMADELWGTRCAYAYGLRMLQETGAVLALGSDAPIEALNPWLGVHAAVTRQRPDGTPPGGWYPDQRISLDAALHGYCVAPAILSAEADQKGMLAPGMLADLVVLAGDPFAMKPETLHSVVVDMTMVGGVVRWQRHT